MSVLGTSFCPNASSHLQQGQSQSQVARELGIDRSTVQKYAHLSHLPLKRSPKSKPKRIAPYWDYLVTRLHQQPLSIRTLLAELRQQGFTGGKSVVQQAMRQIRAQLPLDCPSRLLAAKPHPRVQLTAAKLAAWVLCPKRSSLQQTLIADACGAHADINMAVGLTQDFALFLRQRKPQHLLPWIEVVRSSPLTALKRFATGLLDDFPSIYEACTQPWSNGQVEGHINRLKFLKRQMYGRANFDLLRLRVLATPLCCT